MSPDTGGGFVTHKPTNAKSYDWKYDRENVNKDRDICHSERVSPKGWPQQNPAGKQEHQTDADDHLHYKNGIEDKPIIR